MEMKMVQDNKRKECVRFTRSGQWVKVKGGRGRGDGKDDSKETRCAAV